MELIKSKHTNERGVKQYHAAEWKHPNLSGWLLVTTERLILAGGCEKNLRNEHTEETTTIAYVRAEAELKSIAGIDGSIGRVLNKKWLWLGIASIVLGVLCLITASVAMSAAGAPPLPVKMIVPFALGLVVAAAFIAPGVIALLTLAVRKEFTLNIYSDQRVLISLTGLPTEETEQMMEELGAIIVDLKADKEKAYEAWKE